MKIDYCIFIINKNEWDFLPINLNSLAHYTPASMFNVKACVVEGDTETLTFCEQFPIEIVRLPMFRQRTAPGARELIQVGQDIANRLDYMMKISVADWVVMAHVDIAFHNSLTPIINNHCVDGVGMVGEFCHGVTIVNRDVFDICHFGFWALREGRAKKPPVVFDTATLLGTEMESYGYTHNKNSDLITRYDHAAAQSGHLELYFGDDAERLKADRLNRKEEFMGRQARFKS